MNKLIAVFIFLFASAALFGQTTKLHSIYANFQGKGNVSFMSPLDLGVSFNTKNEYRKILFSLSGYYPNNRTYTSQNLPTHTFSNYQILSRTNDTFTYQSQNLSNGGFGLSIGTMTKFKLHKKTYLLSGSSLSALINFRQYSNRIGFDIENDTTTFGPDYFDRVQFREEADKVTFIPVLHTFIGAEFNMGEHLQLIPRINANLSVYNENNFNPLIGNNLTLKLVLVPSMTLAYKI
jgi:hypothetical protein